MVEIKISIFVALVLFDIILTNKMRALVYSFLLSKHNLKGAGKIHSKQSFLSKITLSYIKDYSIFPKDFSLWHTVWMIHIISILPQYLSLLLIHVFFADYLIASLAVIGIIKLVLLFVVRSQFSITMPSVSRYDRRDK